MEMERNRTMDPELLITITTGEVVDMANFPYKRIAEDFAIQANTIMVVILPAVVHLDGRKATLVRFEFKNQQDYQKEDPKPERAFRASRVTMYRWLETSIDGPWFAVWGAERGRTKFAGFYIPGK